VRVRRNFDLQIRYGQLVDCDSKAAKVSIDLRSTGFAIYNLAQYLK
jgi:hypothetical protein